MRIFVNDFKIVFKRILNLILNLIKIDNVTMFYYLHDITPFKYIL